jgi:hypothetical protein
LATVPPTRPMQEDVLCAGPLRRGWHLARDRPDESGQLPCDGRGDLRLRFATGHQPPEARRQSELRPPGNVTHHLGERFLPIGMLAPDPGNALIRPRRFRQEASHVRIAGLRDRATAHARPAGVLRRHHSQVRHELARVPEAPQVAEFGDQRHRGDERHAAQRLERRHDRCPTPDGRQRSQLLGQALESPLGLVDRVAIFLQRDVLRGARKTEIREPATIGLGPAVRSGLATPLPQEEGLHPVLRLDAHGHRVLRRADEITHRLVAVIGSIDRPQLTRAM